MSGSPMGWRVTPATDFRVGAPEPERESLWVSVSWAREQGAYAKDREAYHRLRSKKLGRPYRWLAFTSPLVVAVSGVCLFLSQGAAWGVVVALIAFAASAAEASFRSWVPWLHQRSQSHAEMEWIWHEVGNDLMTFCDRDARDPMLGHDALRQRLASLERSISNAVENERRPVAPLEAVTSKSAP